ncbi:MAG: hypothetical protein GY924_21485 [Planctomycetaceae bacterium]|nr:hypothetical protein [Planctomycetaceae bacterium]
MNSQALLSDRKKRIACLVLDVATFGCMAATCLLLWWALGGREPIHRELRSNIDLVNGIVLPVRDIAVIYLGYIVLRGCSLLLAVCCIFGRSLRSIIGWFCVATFLLDVPIFLVAQGMVFQYLYLHYA